MKTVADPPQQNTKLNWNPDAVRENKTRLQISTETEDLTKEKLMGPKTDTCEISIGPTENPWIWFSVRIPDHSKGPQERDVSQANKRNLGANSPRKYTPLTQRQNRGPSPYSKWFYRFRWPLLDGITLPVKWGWEWDGRWVRGHGREGKKEGWNEVLRERELGLICKIRKN